MARIDYNDPAKANDRTRELLGKNRNANIFPDDGAFAEPSRDNIAGSAAPSTSQGELDPIVREPAITRTGILCEAPYEIVAHKRINQNVGVTDEQNAALEELDIGGLFPARCSAPRSPSPARIVQLRRPSDATFHYCDRVQTDASARWSNCSSRSAFTS